jgi:glycosyltransferase involved in cell wall biosynthesis
VVRKAPDARFLIVGEGPYTNMLKKMTENLCIDGYVYFAGKVPNDELPKYLRASDVYVSTSFSDGTSNSLLESMACGLPVVVSDISGNREWIHDGKNGFLTSTKDPNALAEKILFLVKNDKARESIRIENIELAKNKANWKQNVNVLYELVEELTRARENR